MIATRRPPPSRLPSAMRPSCASTMAGMGSNNAYAFGEPILALGPEHATILARDGVSKDDIRAFVFAHARVPRETWEKGGMAGMGFAEDLFAGEAGVPPIRKPEHLMIIVVGGPGRHSCWMPTFGAMTRSVTRALTLKKDGVAAKSIQDFRQ